MWKRLQVRVLLYRVVRMEEEDEGSEVQRGVPHKRLAQREGGVDGGVDVVAVWV